VTLAGRYCTGVAIVGLGMALAVLSVPREIRDAVAWGGATAVALQAPLGWWVVRRIGTEGFMVVWGVGMLLRFALIPTAGFAGLALIGRRAGPMLGAMVGVLVALLLVEGVTALREHSWEGKR
jgi:hypothetical protein